MLVEGRKENICPRPVGLSRAKASARGDRFHASSACRHVRCRCRPRGKGPQWHVATHARRHELANVNRARKRPWLADILPSLSGFQLRKPRALRISRPIDLPERQRIRATMREQGLHRPTIKKDPPLLERTRGVLRRRVGKLGIRSLAISFAFAALSQPTPGH